MDDYDLTLDPMVLHAMITEAEERGRIQERAAIMAFLSAIFHSIASGVHLATPSANEGGHDDQ